METDTKDRETQKKKYNTARYLGQCLDAQGILRPWRFHLQDADLTFYKAPPSLLEINLKMTQIKLTQVLVAQDRNGLKAEPHQPPALPCLHSPTKTIRRNWGCMGEQGQWSGGKRSRRQSKVSRPGSWTGSVTMQLYELGPIAWTSTVRS